VSSLMEETMCLTNESIMTVMTLSQFHREPRPPKRAIIMGRGLGVDRWESINQS